MRGREEWMLLSQARRATSTDPLLPDVPWKPPTSGRSGTSTACDPDALVGAGAGPPAAGGM